MPTRPFTRMELDLAQDVAGVMAQIDSDSESSGDEGLVDQLLLAACEPLVKRLKQDVGDEHLSLARLQRECEAHGLVGDDKCRNIYNAYGFWLEDLPNVVALLNPPAGFRTPNGVFTGEEGVLLLLRRYRRPGTLLDMTKETGRNISQLSEAIQYMIEHVHATFPHLLDERSFTAWAPRFSDFARAFRDHGVPIDNLIGFIDGKLWPVCRPGRYQHVLYSGHKRIHGLKTQGIVFPNGIQPYPFGPANGNRHDSFILRESKILDALRDVCRGPPGAPGGLGRDYVLFGDSAYPLSRWLFRMYKGVMTAMQRAFNADMSPARVTVEWGFGKIVNLWPFLDYRKKHAVLLTPVGLHFGVANILTNIHTCLYGSVVTAEFGLSPPSPACYMAGGPF